MTTERRSGSTYWIGILLLLTGVGAVVLLVLAMVADPGVRSALSQDPATTERPSLVLAVIDAFGIIVPAATVGLGLAAGLLGLRVMRNDAAAIRVARDAATWLTLLAWLLTAVRIVQGAGATGASESLWQRAAGGWLVFLLVAVAATVVRYVLARVASRPELPPESLPAREARSAWNLLLPAILVLVMVAARPLEATVITSFTDKRFASSQVPEFVGFQNYRELLTLSFDRVNCREADDGTCLTDASGRTRWNTLEQEKLRAGYRTAWFLSPPGLTRSGEAISISALDRDWWRSLANTVVFTVFSVTGELILGLFLALSVHASFKGRGLMRAVMLVPWAIPTVVSARLWQLMFRDTGNGVVNSLLLDLGVIERPLAWLTQPGLQIPSAIVIDVWKTAPFMGLILLAGLQAIPKELYESARVDGASRLREFFAITLPLLRPAIGIALIFRTLDALRVFDLFQVLFGRSERSISTYNFEALIANQEAGYASAIGVLIFLIIFVFAAMYVRLLGVTRDQ